MIRTAALVVLFPICAFAQLPPVPIEVLGRGDEVRIWSREPSMNGWKLQYLGRTDSSVVVAERSGSARVPGFRNEINFPLVDRLEVYRGKAYDVNYVAGKAFKGAIIGLGVGGAVGLAGDLTNHSGDGGSAPLGTYFGAIAGSVIGGVIGLVRGTRGSSLWVPVTIQGR